MALYHAKMVATYTDSVKVEAADAAAALEHAREFFGNLHDDADNVLVTVEPSIIIDTD